jgi:hypothetical protein
MKRSVEEDVIIVQYSNSVQLLSSLSFNVIQGNKYAQRLLKEQNMN